MTKEEKELKEILSNLTENESVMIANGKTQEVLINKLLTTRS